MKKKSDEADNVLEYMSHTIDDFRNFFMPKKESFYYMKFFCYDNYFIVVKIII